MDFKLEEAISRFDLIQFLDENEIEYSTEGDNIGVGWIGIETCNSCGDSDFHLGINLEGKTTHCWKCGFNTNLIGYVAKVLNIPYKKAEEFIIDETKIDEESDIELRIREILETEEKPLEIKKTNVITLDSSQYVDLNYSLVKKNSILKQFFEDRKLTRSHIDEYKLKIGISGNLKNKLIFPIYYFKKLVSYITRSLFESKYKITGPAHSYLYKYEDLLPKKKIILVEGILDRIRLEDFVRKYYNDEYYTTTMFSKIVSSEQIKLLNKLKPKEIIYMLDNDAWFDYKKTCDQFNCKTSFIILPKEKDPGSMEEKEYLTLFKKNEL